MIDRIQNRVFGLAQSIERTDLAEQGQVRPNFESIRSPQKRARETRNGECGDLLDCWTKPILTRWKSASYEDAISIGKVAKLAGRRRDIRRFRRRDSVSPGGLPVNVARTARFVTEKKARRCTSP